ncbi:hypothetical protein [Luethyella okanaganae]|uniref:Uncharacterized protein n=1 Tax=Luethyella okanaganae TaxID=69372 RepID=A0ABW1VE40_9MICO
MKNEVVGARYGIPPFRFLLPPGWVQLPASEETATALLGRSREVFKRANRPDLDAELSRLTREAFSRMRRAKVFAVYLQQGVTEDELVPMTMSASVLEGRQGASLDDEVASAFRDRGAEFLDENRAIVRWSGESTPDGELRGVTARTIDYVIAVPGMRRRTAVIIQTTIVHAGESPLPEDVLEGLSVLSDSMIGTFTWLSGATP